MTHQNNEAFEKWFESELQKLIDVKNYDDIHMLQINEHLAWKAWQAATQHSEREIAELKAALHEINTLRGTTLNFGVARAIACRALRIKHTDSSEPPSAEPSIKSLQSTIKCMTETAEETSRSYIYQHNKITELKASNLKLREALNTMRDIFDVGGNITISENNALHKADKVLTSTPTQSLQAHDNDLIERCALIVDDFTDCELASELIRALKGTS